MHPRERVLTFPKYLFTGKGAWRGYERLVTKYDVDHIYKAIDKFKWLLKEYLVPLPSFNRKLFSVPVKYIIKHYMPETWLIKAKRRYLDPLEDKALRLAMELSDVSGIPLDSFGVTGSILIGIHNLTLSDINLVVYGRKEAEEVRSSLREYLHRRGKLRGLSNNEILTLALNVSKSRAIPLHYAVKLYEHRWRRGFFEGVPFSVNPVPKVTELPSLYADVTFYPLVPVTVKVKVRKDLSLFYPPACEVSNVTFIEGPKIEPLLKVISYEGLYSDIMIEGYELLVRGLLQRVKEGSRTYYCVTVGVSEIRGGGYILPLNA